MGAMLVNSLRAMIFSPHQARAIAAMGRSYVAAFRWGPPSARKSAPYLSEHGRYAPDHDW